MAQSIASGSGATPNQGMNIAAARKFGGVYVLGFLANFLQTNGDGNILSTPNLLTLDNEEAKIIIGKNVPFLTGSYSNTGGAGGAVNPFQTVERKDIGLTLRVKPQISENGTIKMVIYQEVSSIAPESVLSKEGLITNKRAIETSVLVEDGGIVVLGGLLEDTYSGNVDKIPGLGDVPGLGSLFKSETRSRKKTNLMVFLRPVVLRDAQSTDSLAMDRYDLMRGVQQGAQPEERVAVPVNQAPVLPPMRATAPAAPAAASGWGTAAPAER
jgi:general secretion pathway protein D